MSDQRACIIDNHVKSVNHKEISDIFIQGPFHKIKPLILSSFHSETCYSKETQYKNESEWGKVKTNEDSLWRMKKLLTIAELPYNTRATGKVNNACSRILASSSLTQVLEDPLWLKMQGRGRAHVVLQVWFSLIKIMFNIQFKIISDSNSISPL